MKSRTAAPDRPGQEEDDCASAHRDSEGNTSTPEGGEAAVALAGAPELEVLIFDLP